MPGSRSARKSPSEYSRPRSFFFTLNRFSSFIRFFLLHLVRGAGAGRPAGWRGGSLREAGAVDFRSFSADSFGQRLTCRKPGPSTWRAGGGFGSLAVPTILAALRLSLRRTGGVLHPLSSCRERAVFERDSNPRQAIREWLLYQTELSNGAGRIRTCDGSLGGECSTGLSYRAIDLRCCSGMHEADTRGGLGHRRDWNPCPWAASAMRSRGI